MLCVVRLVSRHTFTASIKDVPFAVSCTQVCWFLLYGGVIHTHPRLLDDSGPLRVCTRVGEDGKVSHQFRADIVEHPDGEDGGTGPRVVEGEVDPLRCYGDLSTLSVNNRVLGTLKCIICGNHVQLRVGVCVPRGHHLIGKVRSRSVISQLEGLLTLKDTVRVWMLCTSPHGEGDFYGYSIGVTPRDERGSQPVVDILGRYVTHGVYPVGITVIIPRRLDPLKTHRKKKVFITERYNGIIKNKVNYPLECVGRETIFFPFEIITSVFLLDNLKWIVIAIFIEIAHANTKNWALKHIKKISKIEKFFPISSLLDQQKCIARIEITLSRCYTQWPNAEQVRVCFMATLTEANMSNCLLEK